MRAQGHRRQVVLFLVAVLLPCVLLMMLGARLLRQERELAEKRVADEQRRLVGEIRQKLLATLEAIKLQQAAAGASPARAPNVALVARLANGRVDLPWERSHAADQFRRLRAEEEFAARIAEAEQEELVAKNAARAAARYEQALAAARHPAQEAYARLLLARALGKGGQPAAAVAQYRRVLSASSDVADEHAVPLAFYAASRLLETDAAASRAAILDRVRAELDADAWMAPAEAYLLRELADALAKGPAASLDAAAEEAQRRISERIRSIEQSLALQNDFPNLPLARAAGGTRQAEPLWVLFGSETPPAWLVGVAPPLGPSKAAVLVAVEAQPVFHAVLESTASDGWRATLWPESSAPAEAAVERLGPSFPNLRIQTVLRADAAPGRQLDLQRRFYLVILLVVGSMTLFGAYILWWDVRRELRLAELRSQFVSSVSHELKTPLTAIRMFAETLRLGRAADPQAQAEYLETIVNESERLTRLLNNVLDFSKIEQGRKIYRPEPTSLPAVVETAARAMHYPLEQQGFTLRLEIEENLPRVLADADALEQAILNLLSNAVKYSGESRAIDLRLCARDGHAVIQVTDHGIGIPEKERARIFEKFYRVPTPENRRIPGTGLGLTLVEHIARAHGGRVEVESAPGRGSTFSLCIPLEARP
jgi:signal transduction histidine kinase